MSASSWKKADVVEAVHRTTGQGPSTSAVRLVSLAVWVLSFHGVAALLTEAVFSHDDFRFGWVYCLLEFQVYIVLLPLRNLRNKAFWLGLFAAVRSLRPLKEPGTVDDAVNNVTDQAAADASTTIDSDCSEEQEDERREMSANKVEVFDYRSALFSGVLFMISHGSGTAAFQHLGFTFGAMCKSAKVPCILCARTLILLSHQITTLEAVGSFFVFLGLTMFGIGERIESPRFNARGLALISVNIFCASYGSNLQQYVLQRGRAATARGGAAGKPKTRTRRTSTSREDTTRPAGGDQPQERLRQDQEQLPREDLLMMLQYTVGFFLLLLYTTVGTGELYQATDWFWRKNLETKTFVFTFTSAAGALSPPAGGGGGNMGFITSSTTGSAGGSSGDFLFHAEVATQPMWTGNMFGYLLPEATALLPAQVTVALPLGYYLLLLAFLDDVFSFIGMRFLFVITKEFDAAITNTICGCRKMITFALSYFFFPKAFGLLHAVGVPLAVGGGMLLQVGAARAAVARMHMQRKQDGQWASVEDRMTKKER